MADFAYHKDDSIYALATPLAQSAIGVIRCSGPTIINDLEPLFRSAKPLSEWESNRMTLADLGEPQGETLDQVMAVVFRNPQSYTGQDSVEINCHGSLPGLESIFQLLQNHGVRQASPGEFTYRAFLNGKMGLSQAEAVQEIVSARSSQAQSLALNRLSGAIEREIKSIQQDILSISAALALSLDYPDDEVEAPEVSTLGIDNAIAKIDRLLNTYNRGKLFQEGIKLALAGRTNAGKSSLFNLILKEERSIVSQVHGTTRDYLEATVSLRGIPLQLFDTAGLRDALDPVEKEGIRRTRQIVDNCQLILLVMDGTQGMEPLEEQFYQEHKDKTILVWNKADLESTEQAPPNAIEISALSGQGFQELEDALNERIFQGVEPPGQGPVIDSLRQKELLEMARDGLSRFLQGLQDQLPLDILSEDIRESLNALGEITGEVSSADVLEALFSQFCVGK